MINLTIIGSVKMIDAIEDSRTEFKIKVVDDLEESVIAFLNKDCGSIYIGVDDNGIIYMSIYDFLLNE